MSDERPKFVPRFSERWERSFRSLDTERRAGCIKAVLALISGRTTPGLRIKPILPERYFLEARIDRGDRIIFRIEGEAISFIDVVKHDDIGRYGRRPRGER